MRRIEFLKSLGVIGLGTMLPLSKSQEAIARAARSDIRSGGGCVLIPSETRGPYPLDLSSNSSMFRRVINETKTGVPLNVTLSIVNTNDNCAPLSNVRVDVWHCDKDGAYSGFNQPGIDTRGQTFCRGIQLSDANGQVQFKTIYPGWYAGRITHIHFEMYVSSLLSATSQLCFPDSLNAEVYATSLYSARGQNTSVANNAADMVFSNGFDYQLATIVKNNQTGGYDASLTVGIAVDPTSGLLTMEPETGGQFTLAQNYPNPFEQSSLIPFSLRSASHVQVDLFDVHGTKVAELCNENLEAGDHSIVVDRTSALSSLSDNCYIYQLRCTNGLGTFSQAKVLTLAN